MTIQTTTPIPLILTTLILVGRKNDFWVRVAEKLNNGFTALLVRFNERGIKCES